MKFLLFTDYGSVELPKFFTKVLSMNEFPYNRCGEIISLVNKNAKEVTIDELSVDFLKSYLEVNKDKFIKIKGKNRYYGYCVDMLGTGYCWFGFSIIDVDTSRPWHIREYDGAESVEYLDYVVDHKDINYCSLKPGEY